jgi:hypothetical protein
MTRGGSSVISRPSARSGRARADSRRDVRREGASPIRSAPADVNSKVVEETNQRFRIPNSGILNPRIRGCEIPSESGIRDPESILSHPLRSDDRPPRNRNRSVTAGGVTDGLGHGDEPSRAVPGGDEPGRAGSGCAGGESRSASPRSRVSRRASSRHPVGRTGSGRRPWPSWFPSRRSVPRLSRCWRTPAGFRPADRGWEGSGCNGR